MQHSNTAAKGSSDLQLLFCREVQGLAGPHVPCSSERCQADTAKRHAGALRALGCARNLPQRRGAPATLLVPRTAQVPGREANPLRHVPQSPRRWTDGRPSSQPTGPSGPDTPARPNIRPAASPTAPRGFYAGGKATRSDRAFPCSPQPPPRSERNHRLRKPQASPQPHSPARATPPASPSPRRRLMTTHGAPAEAGPARRRPELCTSARAGVLPAARASGTPGAADRRPAVLPNRTEPNRTAPRRTAPHRSPAPSVGPRQPAAASSGLLAAE